MFEIPLFLTPTMILFQFENYAFYVVFAAAVLGVIALVWLLRRSRGSSRVGPIVLLGVAALAGAAPYVVKNFIPRSPHEHYVNNQLHITLTNVDNPNYSYLKSRNEA